MPPLVHPEIDAAFREHLDLRGRFRDLHKVEAGWTRTAKASHLDGSGRVDTSGSRARPCFTTPPRSMLRGSSGSRAASGWCRSSAALGATEEELGLSRLDEVTHRVLGDRRVPWVLGYRVRLGVL